MIVCERAAVCVCACVPKQNNNKHQWQLGTPCVLPGNRVGEGDVGDIIDGDVRDVVDADVVVGPSDAARAVAPGRAASWRRGRGADGRHEPHGDEGRRRRPQETQRLLRRPAHETGAHVVDLR